MFKDILNPWIIFGFLAQSVFLFRFIVQWYVSEKQKKSIIPDSFWYLSIAGTIMILVYSIKQKDIVFATASILQMVIYIRNIFLIKKSVKQVKS